MVRFVALPDWADFFPDDARYAAFMDAVAAAVERSPLALEVEAGYLRVLVEGDERGGQHTIGLKSLAQRWQSLAGEAEGERGRALLDDHLRAAAEQLARDPELEAELDDLERARSRLRLRLYNERAAVALASGLVQRRLTRGLFAALVFDLPRSIRPVEPARFASWDVDLDSLWDQARAQTLALPATVEPTRLFERLECVAITGDSLLTSTRMLGLDAILGNLGPLGALAVAPTHHVVLAHALGPGSDRNLAIPVLQQAAARLYEQGPGSLTPELHWVRGTTIEHVRTSRDEHGRLVVGASPEFMAEVLGVTEPATG